MKFFISGVNHYLYFKGWPLCPVTDDGYIVPGSEGLTTLWSIEEQPDPNGVGAAVIADANALETTITLSAAGEYILKLVADDGEYTGEAELIINAISDDWLE